jgi:hypothetical protein
MLYKISVAASVAALLLAGLLQRWWTDYWQTAPALTEAAAQMQQIPMSFGAWRGQPMQVDAADMTSAGYAGCLWRRYEDSRSGSVLSMLLVCGRPGVVSVHTPDACYGGVGYERAVDPAQVNVAALGSDEPAPFWQADFVKPNHASAKRLRIYWSWYAGERWQAPENPRLTFMNFPVLYKLYVVCEITGADEAKKTEACTEFLKNVLPELQKLFAPPAPQPHANGRRFLRVTTACIEL